MKNSKTLIEYLLEEGYSPAEIHHSGTDLYVFKTEVSDRAIDKWLNANHFCHSLVEMDWLGFSRFIDQLTGRPMYDFAMQWYNYNGKEVK